MRYARSAAGAVTLRDGRILVVGSEGNESGVTVDGHAPETAELYDPATGRFTLAGTFPEIDRAAIEQGAEPGSNPVPTEDPEQGSLGSLVATADGGAVLIGHTGWWKHVGDISRSFRFDAGRARWTQIGSTYALVGEPTEKTLITPDVPSLEGAAVASLADGRVLVAGGAGPAIKQGNGYSTDTTAVATYVDPATGSWSPAPAMPEPRGNATTVVISDGSVLVIGGRYSTPESGADLNSAVLFVVGS
jgi:hypothetical protein